MADTLAAILGPDNPLLGAVADMDSTAKKIWVSAIRLRGGGEVQAAAVTDPSYPAFYLEGQSDTGNIRAFAALNACRADGEGCATGIDCCSGFCIDGVCGVRDACSQFKEACTADSDCCPPEAGQAANSCIGGFCDFILVE